MLYSCNRTPFIETAARQISFISVIDQIEDATQNHMPEQSKPKELVYPVKTLNDEDEAKIPMIEAEWDSSLAQTIETHVHPVSDDIKEELLKLENDY
uniref:Uncharacterized protein n=1 Tax=Panagrolaimus davidi TaxID=227884 RepID=A0A914Q3P1_9BILA